MNKYRILWIDDNYDSIRNLMERAELTCGFEITKCQFAIEGMKIFERHLEEWDGVVLDAKFLMESLDEVPKAKALRYCRDRINELKSKRYVPMFVFTGQQDLMSNEMFEDLVDKYYFKGDDDDKLIDDIISAADAQEETQIIHKHQEVFDAWPESRHDLLRILKVLEREDWQNNSVFNDIRKIMSDVVNKLHERGFCPVQHDGSNLSACSTAIGQRYMQEIIPVYIQRSIHSLSDITNPGSHRTKIDSDVANGMAPYLVRTIIYEMLNVLYWCRRIKSTDKETVENAIDIAKIKYEKSKASRNNN